MPYVITATEYLEVFSHTLSVSVPMATPAWRLEGVAQLWDEADASGGDVDTPLTDGGLGAERFRAVATKSMNLFVFGAFDWDGNAYPDHQAGLYTNFAYLRDNVCARVPVADGITRAAVVHLPDGSSTLSADIVTLGAMNPTRKSALIKAFFRFTIPAGLFA